MIHIVDWYDTEVKIDDDLYQRGLCISAYPALQKAWAEADWDTVRLKTTLPVYMNGWYIGEGRPGVEVCLAPRATQPPPRGGRPSHTAMDAYLWAGQKFLSSSGKRVVHRKLGRK